MDHKIIPFELKSAGDDGEMEGHANAFYNVDSAIEIVDRGSFLDCIPQFLLDGFVGGLNHDWDNPCGKPTYAAEDAKGLMVKAKISATSHGKDVRILLKDNVIKKMSIGYRVLGDEQLEDADAVAAYWKRVGYTPTAQDIARSQNGVRLLTKLQLYEFSPVTVPANSMADITRVKQYDPEEHGTERKFEIFLRDAGFTRKESAAITLHGFKGLQRDADETTTEEPITPPDPEPEVKTEETEIETPVIEPEIILTPEITEEKASQDEIRLLYASHLTRHAAYLRAG